MLQIGLLGGFLAMRDGEALALGPQVRRLLALLALEANRPVETDRLLKEFWPESDRSDSLRKNVERLRKALGPESARLRVDHMMVCLNLEGAQVDIAEFVALIEQNIPSSLERAVKLYRGELLQGWEDSWIAAMREDLEVSYLDALKGLASSAMQARNFLKAAYYLRRFVNGCPEMEWGWETLIKAYLSAENRSKALETYQLYTEFLGREAIKRDISLHPSRVIEESVRQIVQAEQNATCAQVQGTSASAVDEPLIASTPLESVGGAVPLDSHYYIERPEDALAYETLARPGSTLLLKGPRQIGKSSLLARALHQSRQQGACVLLTDWQKLSYTELESAEAFFLALAHSLADQLNLDDAPEDAFLPNRSPSSNFERFLCRQVFPAVSSPIVWGIDEADRLFPCAFCDDAFGKFRAWHNERALDPQGPWKNFSLILTYSTEASLFIKNVNQSPFNVGTKITLHDFTREQVQELNARYGGPLTPDDLTRLYRLIGGHPYLVRRSLSAVQQGTESLDSIEVRADSDEGIFADHLERMRFALLLDTELTVAFRKWMRDEELPSPQQAQRLCAAGILKGGSPNALQPRCLLYDRYLRKQLL